MPCQVYHFATPLVKRQMKLQKPNTRNTPMSTSGSKTGSRNDGLAATVLLTNKVTESCGQQVKTLGTSSLSTVLS